MIKEVSYCHKFHTRSVPLIGVLSAMFFVISLLHKSHMRNVSVVAFFNFSCAQKDEILLSGISHTTISQDPGFLDKGFKFIKGGGLIC